MSTSDLISINPEICSGKPYIKGTRIMDWQVLDLLSKGIPTEKIISEEYFPDITIEQIRACIAFANQFMQSGDINFFFEHSQKDTEITEKTKK